VYYLEERPKLDAGPFLEEERNLINAIADRLGHIIEQKQIEEALRKSEERLRLLVESSKDMITLQRSDGTFLYYNGPSVYSIRSEDVLGKTPYDLFEKEEADRMVDQIEEIFQSGGSGYFESLLDWQGKKGWFSEYIYPIFDSDGHIEAVAKICSDITERKLTEEEREKLIHELQNALAEVKTLSGLLPICAHCKNIRDDKGYWNKIENYIHQHSGTQFSHGICPECTKKYYPDIDLNDDSE
jgi:PAS domain S-box-containing protein